MRSMCRFFRAPFCLLLLILPSISTAQGTWSEIPPGERWIHAAAADPATNEMIVVSGITEEGSDARVLRLSLNGVPSWSEMATAGSPPMARYGASLVYDPNGHRMILFGGFGVAYLNDVWALDLTTHAWSQLTPSGAPPSARGYHTAIYDPGHQRMVVFGGFNLGGNQNDTWALTLTGSPAWSPLVTAGAPPSARDSHTAVFDPAERMLVFAGSASGFPMNDTWQLTLPSGVGTPTWSQVATLGPPPSTRYAHAAIYDEANRRMVVFGGGPGTTYMNDVWVLPIATLQWSQLAPLAAPDIGLPSGREFHRAVYDPQNERMVAFGGTTPSTILGDTWSLSLGGTPQWNALTPPPRAYAAVAWDEVRDRMTFFGGLGLNGTRLADLWTYEPTPPAHWSQILPAGSTPPGRSEATMIHDVANDRFVLFAGRGVISPLNDVWALSPGPPATWTQLSPAGPAPINRCGHTAVVDAAGGRMVVFGGGNVMGALGDTWTLSLNGPAAWSQQLASGPPPRTWHVAVFDPVHWGDPSAGHMVVAAGTAGGGALDDTHDWIASATPFWNSLPAGLAPARVGASAAYDPVRDQLLLFSGDVVGGTPFNDLWGLPFYNTKVWSQQFPSGSPPPAREGGGAVYDPVFDRMLVLGGVYQTATANVTLNDFWQLDRSSVRTGVENPVAVELRVSPIRPNPSRGLVRLDLELPQASEVQFAVFDLAGRRAHLSTQSLPAGRHELKWDGGGERGARAPVGVYFAHVKVGGREQVRRFVLIH